MRRLAVLTILTAVLVGGLFVAPAWGAPTRHRYLPPREYIQHTVPATATTCVGLDTSQRPTAAGYASIAAQGYRFMGRYLEISPATAGEWGGKVYYLTASELAGARQAGVELFLIFEWCDGRAHPETSFDAGARDAGIALRALGRLGLPPDTPVYYSLDAVPRATTAQVTAYFRGICSVVPVEAIGCYGSQAQLLALRDAGLITYLWYATWMDGNNLEPTGWGATMYQRCWVIQRGGVWCDQNWRLSEDIGGVH